MWAGRYSDAVEVSAGWSPSGHRLDRLAILDGIALEGLGRMIDLAEQDRRPAAPESIERARTLAAAQNCCARRTPWTHASGFVSSKARVHLYLD